MVLKDLLTVIDSQERLDIEEISYMDGCSFINKNDRIPEKWLNSEVENVRVDDGILTIEICEE